MRFDDQWKNRHNTFAITAEVTTAESRRRRDIQAGGCLHDDIAETFPELASLIPWHLVSTDGPMHYLANTVYHASDRGHDGKRKGEPTRWQTLVTFGDNPICHKLPAKFVRFLQDTKEHNGRPAFDFEIIALDHDDRKTFGTKYTFGGYGVRWHDCPFDTEKAATDFLYALQNCSPVFTEQATAWSEGKERDLAAARHCAVWPEATDEQLTAEPGELKAALTARLPELLARFRDAVEGAGFLWSAE
jgi:hypothetical protein